MPQLPGLTLIASYSTSGDNALPPQATLNAVPESATPHQSITLLWNTFNVAFVEITGTGFSTGLLSTTGSGLYVVGSGFTTSITLTLQAYDQSQTLLAGVISRVTITIT